MRRSILSYGDSLLRNASHVLPITVPNKRDRLTVVCTPVYDRRPEDALRLAVQPRRTSLFHHHIPRFDGEVQASRVDCKQRRKKDIFQTLFRKNLSFFQHKKKTNVYNIIQIYKINKLLFICFINL